MRLLAVADLHGFENVCRWVVVEAGTRRVDAVVLAGDLLGVPDGFSTIEDSMQASADRIGTVLDPLECPVLYVMGNDDLIDLGSRTPDRVAIHGRRVDLGGFGFVGCQCGPPFMGGPFERTPVELEDELNSLLGLIDDRTVFVTHYPAAGILDNDHGLPAIRQIVARSGCLVHIHGHSHSNFGREGRHFNVASAGKQRAMLIDLEQRTYRVIDDHDEQPPVSWS